jgi:hypothetical protein
MFTLTVLTCMFVTSCMETRSPVDYITEERCLQQGAILAGIDRADFGPFTREFPVEHTIVCESFNEQTVLKITTRDGVVSIDKPLGF